MCRAPLGPVEEDSDFESDDSDIDQDNHTILEAAESGDERQMLNQGANNFFASMIHAAVNGHLT